MVCLNRLRLFHRVIFFCFYVISVCSDHHDPLSYDKQQDERKFNKLNEKFESKFRLRRHNYSPILREIIDVDKEDPDDLKMKGGGRFVIMLIPSVTILKMIL